MPPVKKRGCFSRVFSRGRHVACNLLVLYSHKTGAEARLGLSVGKKVGGAVKRNRVKRILRETVRTMNPRPPAGYDYVLLARPPAGGMLRGEDFSKLSAATLALFARAKL